MALTPEQRDAIRSDLKWLITRSGLTAADVGGFLDPPMSARGVQFWVQAGRPTLDHCDQIQGLAKRLRNGAEVERLTAELAEYERDDRERTERHMAERRAAERAGGLGDATPRLREQAFAELREVRAELAQARQRNEVLEKALGKLTHEFYSDYGRDDACWAETFYQGRCGEAASHPIHRTVRALTGQDRERR